MFKGMYYKHQKNGKTVCLIEGEASDGRFLQVLTNTAVYYFDKYDACQFSLSGIKLDLPNIKGEIRYSQLMPLKSDIMGPFQFLPMPCRHAVYSMRHILHGWLEIDGEVINFDDGIGYIEGDSGKSFPETYLWLHGNDFPRACSIMVSAAQIRFCGVHFLGCICAIIYGGKEYRLASYKGVRVVHASPKGMILTQGNLRLEVRVKRGKSYPLKAPLNGKMNTTVFQSNNTAAAFKLYEGKRLVFNLQSQNVSFECSF